MTGYNIKGLILLVCWLLSAQCCRTFQAHTTLLATPTSNYPFKSLVAQPQWKLLCPCILTVRDSTCSRGYSIMIAALCILLLLIGLGDILRYFASVFVVIHILLVHCPLVVCLNMLSFQLCNVSRTTHSIHQSNPC